MDGAEALSIGPFLKVNGDLLLWPLKITYGIHPPTVSFPVPNCFMIEPTETENPENINYFIDVSIETIVCSNVEDEYKIQNNSVR